MHLLSDQLIAGKYIYVSDIDGDFIGKIINAHISSSMMPYLIIELCDYCKQVLESDKITYVIQPRGVTILTYDTLDDAYAQHIDLFL